MLIFADDAFQIHETIGLSMSQIFDFGEHAALSGPDLGEFTYFLAAGAVVVFCAAMVMRNSGASSRVMSEHYIVILAGLASFGIGVDALHQMVVHLTEGIPALLLLDPIFALIEDGGEMLVASVALALTLTVLARRPTVTSASH